MNVSSNTTSTLLGQKLSIPNIAVPQNTSPGLAQSAATLSLNAGLVASMSGDATPEEADATTMLSCLSQPYDSSKTLTAGDSATTAQTTVESQILYGTGSDTDSLLNSVYNSSGNVISQSSSNAWVALLRSNPTISNTMADASMKLTIVKHLSAYA